MYKYWINGNIFLQQKAKAGYRIYSNWGTGCEDQVLKGALFRNKITLIFLLMSAKFVMVNKGKVMLRK